MSNAGTKIVIDGQDYIVEFDDTKFVCPICQDEYNEEPFGGYCDNSLECACDGGESLIALP